MNHKEIFKTRPSIEEAKPLVEEFFQNQRLLYVAMNNDTEYPTVEAIDYFYCQGQHIAVVPPMSQFVKVLGEGTKFAAFIQDGVGKGAKKFHGQLTSHLLSAEATVLDELEKSYPMIGKMRSHGAKFLKLHMNQALVTLSGAQVYEIDDELNLTFAKFTANGKERFENSRQVLMTYPNGDAKEEREVIFSVFIADGTYYCLAKSDSNKMGHIKNGGICKIYDGKDNHFETTIHIVDEKKDEIFEKLKATNNAYFKENNNLTALSFGKSGI
ncbi:MAG: hypothetical protein R3Y58_01495 [Eubacteriales bacterium]